MKIKTVKQIKDIFLVNGSISVPNDANNKDYRAVQNWIAEGGQVSPEFSDAELLENAIERKKQEIEEQRKTFIYLPVDYLSTSFTNSEVSGNNLQAVFSFLEEPIDWLDINGNPVTLTKAKVKTLISLIMQHRSKGYFLEASLKKEADACKTVKQVNDLNIEFK